MGICCSSISVNASKFLLVVARLASMRVNSCTTQVKECLQSEDRCGEDYTQCIGLDTDTIIRMCPEELLVGCQDYEMGENVEKTGNSQEDFYAKLEPWVQGIMLNIDNNLLEECQQAADEAMVTVCGDTENCDNLTVDQYIGANTLEYKVCEMSNSENSTAIDYNSCRTDLSQVTDEDLGLYLNDRKDFVIIIEGGIPWENIIFDDDGKISILDIDTNIENKEKIESEMAILQNNINNAIQAIEADSKVQFCMTGREVQGIKNVVNRQGGRFDNLTQQMRAIIATSAIKIAMNNYQQKYEELEQRRMQDYVTLNERIAEINAENILERRRESARVACVGLADASTFKKMSEDADNELEQYTGQETNNRWNYKETVTSTFNRETLVCHRCVRTQNCSKPKGGRRFCKKWANPEETCTDIQF